MYGLKLDSWWFTIMLAATLLLVANMEKGYYCHIIIDEVEAQHIDIEINLPLEQPCDEFYEVGEGETFYSIAEKCNDPFISLWNPHIEDPDDIFPGVILRLKPFP